MYQRVRAYFWRRRIQYASIFAIAAVLSAMLALSPFYSVSAARFTNRGLYINSARASDTTYYILTLGYPTPSPVGSLRLEFCGNPIPDLPCNPPAGLDVSSATLSEQSGSTIGYSVVEQMSNLIVLSRSPSMPGGGTTSYRFDNIVNPADDTQDFYIRLTSHASMDGSGPLIDFGSVSATTTPELGFYTQVPPVLIFCVAAQINDPDCQDTSGNYVDFGELDDTQTFYVTSEIQARTNARYGYSISLTGRTMTSGIKVIPALETPTQSFPGVSQFGMNLAVNSAPAVGASPVGPGTNAVVNPVYEASNEFLFNSGDVIVTSDDVTLNRKFTASYIINVAEDQPAGVYSTTITYICIAGF